MNEKVLKKIVKLIKNKKVVVLPTDTIYGLHGYSLDKEVFDKIMEIKKRPKEKKFILVFSDLKMVKRFCRLNFFEKRLAEEWPAPFTLLLKAKNNLPDFLKKDGRVGVRIPANEFLRKVIKEVGVPLISTSVNISGEKELKDGKEIKKRFGNKVDFVLDVGKLEGKPSTVIKVEKGKIEILRKGNYIPKTL